MNAHNSIDIGFDEQVSSKDIIEIMQECEEKKFTTIIKDDVIEFYKKAITFMSMHHIQGSASSLNFVSAIQFLNKEIAELLHSSSENTSLSSDKFPGWIKEKIRQSSATPEEERLLNHVIADMVSSMLDIQKSGETVTEDTIQSAMTLLAAIFCNAYKRGFASANDVHIAGYFFDRAYKDV